MLHHVHLWLRDGLCVRALCNLYLLMEASAVLDSASHAESESQIIKTALTFNVCAFLVSVLFRYLLPLLIYVRFSRNFYQLRSCFKMTSRCFPFSRSGDKNKIIRGSNVKEVHSIFFQNEEIFIQLDELDKLYRVTNA